MKRVAALLGVVALAGCGGSATAPHAAKPPRIPRALAHSWAVQADAVATSLAAGDGCTALRQATELRDSVAQAQTQVPARLRGQLTAVVEQLPSRITCNPAPPPDHGNGNDHGHHHGHGHGNGEGD